jgi:divalent metal cation (Fe/Co/Zn/Cd) transporter
MGPGIYLDLHLLVNGSMSVRQGHDISETARQELLNRGPDVLDAVVHLEPVD